MSEKCIICDIELNQNEIFLCKPHTGELIKELKQGTTIIFNPSFKVHCHICGEWENRIIINYPEWAYICNDCLEKALDKYKNS